eukprot:CAMPEP_0181320024 /NCGR_PEP_ID=MMETSP1101-20121128/17894_1 /TAXON_ID=46948 /ORGANISM="Rhodomonas abbreviata, Strain Caron Lab Isolate" /LENGTH=370 /DNA_ID=CAMNT_0023427683 /DNA_START=41 /DNA_END=1149 /DNA_ORIENTATION=+
MAETAEVKVDAAPAKEEEKATEAVAENGTAAAEGEKKPEEPVEVDPRVKKQIEFYFSDSNLPKDKFLLSKHKETPEGWIDISLLTSFKRMKEFGATVAGVVAAAKTSDFLAVDDEGKKIRRTTDLPDSDITLGRSIKVGKFPLDTTIDKFEEFFSQHGKVLSVRLIKAEQKGSKEGTFEGNAFIEFGTKDEAEKICKSEIEHEGEKLVMAMKEEYLKETAAAKSENSRPNTRKRSREDDEGGEKEGEKEEKKAKKEGGDKKDKEKSGYVSYPKGVFVKVDGIGEGASMPTIKDMFGKYGNVKFVEFREGDKVACVRFETPEEASDAVKGEGESKTEICGTVPAVSLITGEEEDAKLEDIKQRQMSKMARG